MDELRERLAEIADLERVSMLLAWDQEVCMPPAGARGARRAARDRRAPGPRALHRRARRRAAGERGAARRARGRHRARRPARLRQGPPRPRRARGRDGARRGGRARRLDAGARGQRLRAASRPTCERNIELRRRYSACFPEAEHPYDPLLDDYEPGMRTAECARRPRAPARRPRPARGRRRREVDDAVLRAARSRGRPARAGRHRAARRSASTTSSGAWTTRPTRSRRRSP